MDIVKMIIDGNMQPLYMMNPKGEMLERIVNLETQLYAYSANHPEAVDIVGEAGLREEYNKLYMELMSGDTGVSVSKVMEHIEYTREKYEDNAIGMRINAELKAIEEALVFGWKDAKEKIAMGHPKMIEYAQSMVLIRKLAKRYHTLVCDEKALSIAEPTVEEMISTTPIEKILLST